MKNGHSCGKFLSIMASLFILFSQVSCSKDDDKPVVNSTASFLFTSERTFPVVVEFINTSNTLNTPGHNFQWYLGDGTTTTETNPTHTYSSGNVYNVSLSEFHPSGSSTVGAQIDLSTQGPSGTSTGRPQNTSFTFNFQKKFVVTFTNNSTNATSSHWDFGDGTEATDPGNSFTHTYTNVNTATVLLTTTGTNSTDNTSAVISF